MTRAGAGGIMRRCAGILSLCALTAACVTPERPPERRLASEGYVVVRVVTNAHAVNTVALRFQGFSLHSLWSDKTYADLELLSGAGQPTQVYGGWAVPGSYELFGLWVNPTPNLQVYAMFEGPTTPVEVRFQTLNDLGTVVYQPIAEHGALLVPAGPGADVRPYIDRRLPSIADALFASVYRPSPSLTLPVHIGKTDAQVVGAPAYDIMNAIKRGLLSPDLGPHWREASTESEWLALLKRSTVALHGARHLSSGDTAIGSALGQLLLRAPEGQWRTLDLGTTSEILSLAESPDGLLCGTDLGELFLVDPKLGSVRPVAVPGASGAFLLVSRIRGDRYLVAARLVDQVTLYELTNPLSPSLRDLGSVTLEPSLARSIQPGGGFDVVARAGNTVLVAQSTRNLRAFDLEAGTWRDVSSPGSYNKLKGDSSESLFLLADTASLLWHTHYLSTDGGATWQSVPAPHGATDLALTASGRGYGVESKAFGSSVMHVTDDGGQHWAEAPKVSPCMSFTVDASLPRAFCATDQGEVYSAGLASDWKTEWRTH